MWTRHRDDAIRGGVTAEQIADLEAEDMVLDAAVWPEKERAMLGFLDGVISSPVVSGVVFERMRTYFNEREIVEILTMQVSTLGFT